MKRIEFSLVTEIMDENLFRTVAAEHGAHGDTISEVIKGFFADPARILACGCRVAEETHVVPASGSDAYAIIVSLDVENEQILRDAAVRQFHESTGDDREWHHATLQEAAYNVLVTSRSDLAPSKHDLGFDILATDYDTEPDAESEQTGTPTCGM